MGNVPEVTGSYSVQAQVVCVTCSSEEFMLARRKLLTLGARYHGALLYIREITDHEGITESEHLGASCPGFFSQWKSLSSQAVEFLALESLLQSW